MPATVRLARHAMNTRFELVLHGEDPVALRAAGEEALDEIDRLEGQLSLFRPTSEIAHLNARASREPVRVTPAVFALLQHAQRLHAETGGAFDITLAPLLRCWGLLGSTTGRVPGPEELEEVRTRIGMRWIHLNERALTVRFARDGVMLDLGAIGKGYAVDRAVEILRDAGIASALLHGGTSTAYALGRPPDAAAWQVAVDGPPRSPGGARPLLAVVPLRDESLSVSAVWGKAFQAHGKTCGHVLDPRTARPAENAVLAAVVLPSATETDAFSTALLVVGGAGHERIGNLRPDMRTLLVAQRPGDERLACEARGVRLETAA